MTKGKRIVIIGGGLGGLVTGAFLAKEGFAVTVLEKNRTVGGGLQCFKRGGKTFETGMHILGGFMPGCTLHKIFTYLGIMDSLDMRFTEEECMDSVAYGVEEETYRLPRGKKAFEAYLAQRFPTQAEGLHQYMEALWKLSDEVDLFHLRTSPTGMPRLHSEEFLLPADEFIDRYIDDPALAELLAYMNPMYGGVKGHTPAYIHALINVLYINGSSLFVGGSQQMADALCDVIRAAGGSIHAADPVVAVTVADGLASNVLTQSGCTYEADWYISDIHPCTLLDLLPEKAFPKAYRNRLREIPNSNSSFSVYIKFKPEARQPFAPHPCYYQVRHGLSWNLCDYDEADFPLGLMCITPPSPGQGPWADRMTVNCPMPFSAVAQWADTTTGHRAPDYEAWKSRMCRQVIGRLEAWRPGITDDIEEAWSASPLTVRDYFGTKEGTIYGYSKDCTNMALSQVPIATKVRNLLLTGQNINLHGICGVPLTAIETAECIVGAGNIVRKINEAYDKRNKF